MRAHLASALTMPVAPSFIARGMRMHEMREKIMIAERIRVVMRSDQAYRFDELQLRVWQTRINKSIAFGSLGSFSVFYSIDILSNECQSKQ